MTMGDRLLIDTNLLLVMIIGGVDGGRYIARSKRLNQFSIEDYDNLWQFVRDYKEIWITPYIAAEVSNLIDLTGLARVKAFEIARVMFKEFSQVEVSISADCDDDLFDKFGLTDNSIIKLAAKFNILTSDQKMLLPLNESSPVLILPYIPFKAR